MLSFLGSVRYFTPISAITHNQLKCMAINSIVETLLINFFITPSLLFVDNVKNCVN